MVCVSLHALGSDYAGAAEGEALPVKTCFSGVARLVKAVRMKAGGMLEQPRAKHYR
jgi:hypothetical protein